ncbi:MAG: serine hydrolase [Propionibacteriaceae bacterium]
MSERLEEAWDDVLGNQDGLFSLELRSGDVLASRDAHACHYPASTVKLAVLMALLRDRTAHVPAARGSVVVHDRFPSAVGGTFRLAQSGDQDDETWARLGTEVDLMELADRMVTVSSNIATDLIIERIGFPSVRRCLTDLGLASELRVDRLIGDDTAEAAGTTNTVTASALARLMTSIATGTDADSATALGLLARQTHRDMIPAGLPQDAWSASKGGWVPGVKHDVALVRPPAAPEYVLAVCTTADLPHAEGMELVARLSAVTWEEWVGWHAS